MAELGAGDTPAQVCALRLAGHFPVTVSCLDWSQVSTVRFSSIFQHNLSPEPAERRAVPAEPVAERAPEAPAAQELPEDLDARVRLLGEWQLLEG